MDLYESELYLFQVKYFHKYHSEKQKHHPEGTAGFAIKMIKVHNPSEWDSGVSSSLEMGEGGPSISTIPSSNGIMTGSSFFVTKLPFEFVFWPKCSFIC